MIPQWRDTLSAPNRRRSYLNRHDSHKTVPRCCYQVKQLILSFISFYYVAHVNLQVLSTWTAAFCEQESLKEVPVQGGAYFI